MRPLYMRRFWGVGVGALVVFGLLAMLVLGGRGSGGRVELAAKQPHWTFTVSNATSSVPVQFEVLFRVGSQVRVVRAKTPAEFRVGNRRLVAQFRTVLPLHGLQVDLQMEGSPVGSAVYNPDLHADPLTFVSTHGRLGVPGVGAWGWMYPRWAARETYPKPWSLWPGFWRPATEEELDALPQAEVWPESNASQGAVSVSTSNPAPPR